MMKHLSKQMTEKEVYQQIITAIERAADQGQPVQEIYEAIEAGEEVQVKLEPADAGKVRLIISV